MYKSSAIALNPHEGDYDDNLWKVKKECAHAGAVGALSRTALKAKRVKSKEEDFKYVIASLASNNLDREEAAMNSYSGEHYPEQLIQKFKLGSSAVLVGILVIAGALLFSSRISTVVGSWLVAIGVLIVAQSLLEGENILEQQKSK